MNITLDHILWAAPDLDTGTQVFEDLTGVVPAPGGSHPGFGTRNALSSFSNRTYLEVLAPDPAQSLSGTWGALVASLSRPQMFSFALACDDLEAVATNAENAGVKVQAPLSMSRQLADGRMLNWRIMRLDDPRWEGRLPFFIDWLDAPHPGGTTAGGTTLKEIYAVDPDPDALRNLYRAIGSDMEVYAGVEHGFVARLETPKGDVILT